MAVALAGVVNFVAAVGIALWLGGEALTGASENGRYFFSGFDGKPFEVSGWIYAYGKIHGLSVLATHPLAMIACWKLTDKPMPHSAV